VAIFIGPTLLGLAVAIANQWLNHRNTVTHSERL